MSIKYCDWVTGSDTTGDGSAGNPYKTIDKASDGLTGGDEVRVAKGPANTTLTGTLEFAEGSQEVVGTDTEFTTELAVNDYISDGRGGWLKVTAITDDENITVNGAYTGEDGAIGVALIKAGLISAGGGFGALDEWQNLMGGGIDDGDRLKVSGGWNLSNQTQDGETKYVSGNDPDLEGIGGLGLNMGGATYVEVEDITFLFFYYSISGGGGDHNYYKNIVGNDSNGSIVFGNYDYAENCNGNYTNFGLIMYSEDMSTSAHDLHFLNCVCEGISQLRMDGAYNSIFEGGSYRGSYWETSWGTGGGFIIFKDFDGQGCGWDFWTQLADMYFENISGDLTGIDASDEYGVAGNISLKNIRVSSLSGLVGVTVFDNLTLLGSQFYSMSPVTIGVNLIFEGFTGGYAFDLPLGTYCKIKGVDIDEAGDITQFGYAGNGFEEMTLLLDNVVGDNLTEREYVSFNKYGLCRRNSAEAMEVDTFCVEIKPSGGSGNLGYVKSSVYFNVKAGVGKTVSFYTKRGGSYDGSDLESRVLFEGVVVDDWSGRIHQGTSWLQASIAIDGGDIPYDGVLELQFRAKGNLDNADSIYIDGAQIA